MTNNQQFEVWRRAQEAELTQKLEALLPSILSRHVFYPECEGDLKKQQMSLNAKIGGKHKLYFNITDRVVSSADDFVSCWLDGIVNYIKTVDKGYEEKRAAYQFQQLLASDPELLEYVVLFLKRTYWRNCYALAKKRPAEKEAAIWIGQKNAEYGLLITPRFKRGEWENDVSEIRHFRPAYWTIGHIMQTGLVIPHAEEKIEFTSVDQYLAFFKNVLVRLSGSPYERNIAEKYCDFVKNIENPYRVPLLIPEFRYGGMDMHHKYRLDFTIINPYTLEKQGFEFSPWSTHGALAGTKDKTQKEINEEAKANFEKEMEKQKAYYREYGVYTLIYTDTDLTDMDAVFEEMKCYLQPVQENKLLLQTAMDRFTSFSI